MVEPSSSLRNYLWVLLNRLVVAATVTTGSGMLVFFPTQSDVPSRRPSRRVLESLYRPDGGRMRLGASVVDGRFTS